MDAHRHKGTKMTQGIALVLQVLIFLKGAGSNATTILVPSHSSVSLTSSSLSPTSSSQISTVYQTSSKPANVTSTPTPSTSSSASATTVATISSFSSSESDSVTPSSTAAAYTTTFASSSATSSTSVQEAITNAIATTTGQSMTFSTPSLDSATSSTLQPSSSFSLSIFSTSSTPSTVPKPAEDPVRPAFVRVSFSMLWARFCFLTSLFIKSLSQAMIVVKDGRWEYLSTGKIKLMNRDEKCGNRSHFDQETVLKFYISYSEQDYGQNDADNKRTEEAYKILDSYWKDDTVVLLDRLFAGKVTKVECCECFGKANFCRVSDEYTEAERVGIGIGIGLGITVLVVVIIQVIKRYQVTDNCRAKPEDTKRVFTNAAALEEDSPQGSSTFIANQHHSSDEPEEIEIHQLSPETEKSVVVIKGQDEIPLQSAVIDFEEGKKVDGNKPGEETTEEVPGRDPSEKTSDDPTNVDTETPSNPEEKDTGQRRSTFTSSMTIDVTPGAKSTPTEFELPGQDDDDGRSTSGATKPDPSQLRSSDDDPNQGVINHAFELQTDQHDSDKGTKF